MRGWRPGWCRRGWAGRWRGSGSAAGRLSAQARSAARPADSETGALTATWEEIGVFFIILSLTKKEYQIFLINKENQNGAVAMNNGLLIYGEIFAHFHIY
jgi:hypothetical protein